jgi:hypothetical protein
MVRDTDGDGTVDFYDEDRDGDGCKDDLDGDGHPDCHDPDGIVYPPAPPAPPAPPSCRPVATSTTPTATVTG